MPPESALLTAQQATPAPVLPGQIRLGVTHSLPAVLGVLPMGLAFGVFATHSGLEWWWATVFATVV